MTVSTPPPIAVAGEVFNVGHSDENFTKRMIVEVGSGATRGEGQGEVRGGRTGIRATTGSTSTRSARGSASSPTIASRRASPQSLEAVRAGVFADCPRATRLLHQSRDQRSRCARPTRGERASADARRDPRRWPAGPDCAPYTTVLPKPLVPVGERPILELILHQLCDGRIQSRRSLRRPSRRADPRLSDRLRHGSRRRWSSSYHVEDEPLGTAGAIRKLEEPERALPGHERRHPHHPALRRPDARFHDGTRGGADDRLPPRGRPASISG